MTETIPEKLEEQLRQHLGEAVPTHAANDINPALELSEIMEARGFSFQLKDLCPKSLNQTKWRAAFSKDGLEFSAENALSAVAVCTAALAALTHP